MMARFVNSLGRGATALAGLVMLCSPALAQMPPPPPGPGGPPPGQNYGQPVKKHHHHSGIGAGLAAGVVGGLVGGALLNGGAQAAPGYAPPPPPPPPPGPRYGYDADDEEVVCHMVRKPVYDEDGEVVSYKTRRVCN